MTKISSLLFCFAALTAFAQKVEYVENARVKVGVDLDAGGAIMHVEDKLLKTGNIINYFDRGRQIQQSYYSGPVPYIGPKGERPNQRWAGLGWNPIQTGDCAGNASPVLSFTRPTASAMKIVTSPMLWPHAGVRAECTFTTLIELTPNGFLFTASIANARSDHADYGRKAQETPAVYTNARWYKLVSYLGEKPWTGAPLTTIVAKGDGKGWPWRNYFSPESWSALVDDADTGIGVYAPATHATTAGFAGGDAPKGQNLSPRAAPTGYIAPLAYNVLDHNARLGYQALFAVGKLAEIRQTFAAEAKRRIRPFAWTFSTERLGWVHEQSTSTGYPLKGAYAVTLKKNARLLSPLVFAPAATARTVKFTAASTPAEKGTTAPLEIVVALERFAPADTIDYPAWNEGTVNVAAYRAEKAKTHPALPPVVLKATLPADGRPHDFTLPVPSTAGAFKQIKFTFPAVTGGTFSLYSVSLAGESEPRLPHPAGS